MKKITFPKAEKNDVKAKLKESSKVITTRVSKDFGRFRVGERLEYAGFFLRVVEVKSFDDLAEHPFLGELDEKVKQRLERYGKYEVLWLEVIE